MTNYSHWVLLFAVTGFAGRFQADFNCKLNPTSSWPRSSYLSVMSQIHIFKYNFMSSSCSYPSSSYNDIHVFKFILNSGFPKLPKSHPQRSWIRIKAIDVTREWHNKDGYKVAKVISRQAWCNLRYDHNITGIWNRVINIAINDIRW